MTVQDVWRTKSDDQVLAASQRLDEYSGVAQAAIIGELERRRKVGLLQPLVVEDVLVRDSGEVDETSAHRLLRRVWAGEVSLPVTFWLWGVVGRMVAAVALLFALRQPALMLLAVLLNLAYYILIVIAIWRSAGRYTGPRIWSDLARLGLVLGVLQGIGRLLLL